MLRPIAPSRGTPGARHIRGLGPGWIFQQWGQTDLDTLVPRQASDSRDEGLDRRNRGVYFRCQQPEDMAGSSPYRPPCLQDGHLDFSGRGSGGMCETAGREGVITAVGQDEFSPWSWQGNGHGGGGLPCISLLSRLICSGGWDVPVIAKHLHGCIQKVWQEASTRCLVSA